MQHFNTLLYCVHCLVKLGVKTNKNAIKQGGGVWGWPTIRVLLGRFLSGRAVQSRTQVCEVVQARLAMVKR
jgi:hypothetical protein